MKNLGQLLKSEREKKQLSLHEVGIYLKISPRVLQSIEDGELSKLPAKTFLRGFVRSYALHLRLNVSDVLDLFQREWAEPHPEEVVTETSVAAEPSGESESTPVKVKESVGNIRP